MTNDSHDRLGVILLFFGATVLVSGCGADNESKPASSREAACTPTGNGFLCAPNELKGFPFVSFAVSYSYFGVFSGGTPPAGETTVTMTQPESGKLCLSGRVAPDEVLAGFNLQVAPRSQAGTKILEPFDAAQLGITDVAFTIDSPPSSGVSLSLSTVKQLECPDGPLDCSYGFYFGELGAGRVSVPFSDFVAGDDSHTPVDASILDALYFHVGPGDYDFCVRDLQWLDAQGVEVEP